MMRGAAVIASDVGGIPEIVETGVTGLLTARGDVDALATALIALLEDRERCEAMGSEGKLRAERLFSRDTFVTRFEELYEAILYEKNGNSSSHPV